MSKGQLVQADEYGYLLIVGDMSKVNCIELRFLRPNQEFVVELIERDT